MMEKIEEMAEVPESEAVLPLNMLKTSPIEPEGNKENDREEKDTLAISPPNRRATRERMNAILGDINQKAEKLVRREENQGESHDPMPDRHGQAENEHDGTSEEPPAPGQLSLEGEIEQVSTKVTDLLSKRTDIARRLNELRRVDMSRLERKRDLERSIFLIQKRAAMDEILKRKVDEEELGARLREIETKQAKILARTEAVDSVLHARESASSPEKLQQRHNMWKEKISDDFSHMGDEHHGDISNILMSEQLDDDRVHREVAQHMGQVLETRHGESLSRIRKSQKKLHNERVVLTDALDKLRKSSMSKDEWLDKEHETMTKLFDGIHNAEERIIEQRKVISTTVDQLQKEMTWLEENPESAMWRQMKSRFNEIRDSKDKTQEEVEVLKFFFASREEREGLREEERRREITEEVSRTFGHDVLEEVLSDELAGVVDECMTTVAAVKADLQMTLIKAVLCSGDESMQPVDTSGKIFLYRGNFTDMSFEERRRLRAHKHARGKAAAEGLSAAVGADTAVVTLSQPVANYHLPAPEAVSMWRKPPDNRLAMAEALDTFEDLRGREDLKECEASFWNVITLMPASTESPALPLASGDIATIACPFARPALGMSIIAVGLKTGQMKLFSVPWNSSKPAQLCDLTPPIKNKKLMCPLKDIRECVIGTHIATLDDRGIVRLWSASDLNHLRSSDGRSLDHPRDMFPADPRSYNPVNGPMTCMFTMDPWALNVPHFTDRADFVRSKKQKAFDKCQEGLEVKKMCFHGSMTLFGRQPSLMLGTEGGSLYKLNIDRQVPELDAPLVHQPPFVRLEYQNPRDVEDESKAHHLLVQGSKAHKGNRVEREIFHHHKSEITFLEVVGATSERIISVDKLGELSIWKYDKQYFSGQCRFVPETNLEISSTVMWFEPVGPEVAIERPPFPPSRLHKWRVSSSESTDQSEVNEQFLPPKGAASSAASTVDREFDVYNLKTTTYHKDTAQMGGEDDAEVLGEGDGEVDGEGNKASNEREAAKQRAMTMSWFSRPHKRTEYSGRLCMVAISDDKEQVVMAMDYEKGANRIVTLLPLDMETLAYRRPYPTLECTIGDKLKDLVVGPVVRETLSRFAICSFASGKVRIVSLDTAEEFPALLPAARLGAGRVSVCGAMRVLTSLLPNGKVLSTLFRDSAIRSKSTRRRKATAGNSPRVNEGPSIKQLDYRASAALRYPPAEQNKKATEAFAVGVSDLSGDGDDDAGATSAEVWEERHNITRFISDELFPDVLGMAFQTVDGHRLAKRKRLMLASLYNRPENYGVIEPSIWPSPDRKELLESRAAGHEPESFPLEEFEEIIEGDRAATPEVIKTVRGTGIGLGCRVSTPELDKKAMLVDLQRLLDEELP